MCSHFFFQAEDGIRDLVRSRGLGDVYKRQMNKAAGVVFQLPLPLLVILEDGDRAGAKGAIVQLSLIHI